MKDVIIVVKPSSHGQSLDSCSMAWEYFFEERIKYNPRSSRQMSRKAPEKGTGVSSKFAKFYDPKQTRADRAKVRATHRDISDLIEKEKDVLTNQVLEEAKIFDEENGYSKTVFHKIKGKIEENYENVNRTREGVGDLRNLQDLTKTSFLASRSLVESNKHVNPDAIIQGIKLR